MKAPVAAMVNVLGPETMSTAMESSNAALQIENAAVHWYGKLECGGRYIATFLYTLRGRHCFGTPHTGQINVLRPYGIGLRSTCYYRWCRWCGTFTRDGSGHDTSTRHWCTCQDVVRDRFVVKYCTNAQGCTRCNGSDW
jgi:hypothetical protein